MSASQLQQHASLLLRLPRELRDLIYPRIITESSPIPLYSTTRHPLTEPLQSDPTIAAEALEAYYQYNTFTVELDSLSSNISQEGHVNELFHPQTSATARIPFDIRPHIRHLIVAAHESLAHHEVQRAAFPAMEAQLQNDDASRKPWTMLLQLRKLESLVVNLQKRNDRLMHWVNFTPILYALRETCPGISITVNISFDELLEQAWRDPHWETFSAGEPPVPYQPMGFVEVSDLFAPPSEEDRVYVNEYVPHRAMPLLGVGVRAGLLDEFPAQRRVLGTWYVVREPPLLRVLIEEHYRVYKEVEKRKL